MLTTAQNWLHRISTLLVGAIAAVIVYLIMTLYLTSDFMGHINSTIKISLGLRMMPGSFMFFWLMQIISFYSSNYHYLIVCTAILIGACIAAKFYLSFSFGMRYLSLQNNSFKYTGAFLLVCVALIFVQAFPSIIPNQTTGTLFSRFMFFDGKISPNNWHNSTVILVMPFALLLFWRSYAYLDKPELGTLLQIFVLCLINVLVKPSFFFVFVLVFPVFVYARHGFSQALRQTLMVLFISGLCLVLEYYSVYQTPQSLSQKTGIAIAPFRVWKSYSDNMLRDFFFSELFPLSILLFYFKKLKTNPLFRYAFVLFVVGIMLFINFTETGRWEHHGNFAWQNIICNYIFFYVTALLWLQQIANRKTFVLKDGIITCILAAHTIFGCLYLYKCFLFHMCYHI